MLLGLGYGCRIRVCVRHGYGSIFVSFSIYLKDRSVIPMSGLERHTHVRHGYFRENEESEQHRLYGSNAFNGKLCSSSGKLSSDVNKKIRYLGIKWKIYQETRLGYNCFQSVFGG